MSEVSLLVILDGFGYREEATDNAIAQAHTPPGMRYGQPVRTP